jgi:hypothetical protein
MRAGRPDGTLTLGVAVAPHGYRDLQRADHWLDRGARRGAATLHRMARDDCGGRGRGQSLTPRADTADVGQRFADRGRRFRVSGERGRCPAPSYKTATLFNLVVAARQRERLSKRRRPIRVVAVHREQPHVSAPLRGAWTERGAVVACQCCVRAKAASKATSEGSKSMPRVKARALRAPYSRSIPGSSHSIDSGPA